MSLWRLKFSDLFRREPLLKEGKAPLRAGAKGSGKGTGKGGAAQEVAPVDRSLLWLLSGAVLVLVLHLLAFPPVPRLDVDFPVAGEIAAKEIKAPFGFEVRLLDSDVEMERLNRVVVEPPVLQVLPRDGHSGRMEAWLGALGEALADTVTPAAARVGLLSLQFPMVEQSELQQLFQSPEPDSLVPRMERVWHSVSRGGVVDMLPPGRYNRVVIRDEQNESLRELDRVVLQDNLEKSLVPELWSTGLGPQESADAAAVMRHLISPNLVYDPQLTRQRQQLVRDAVPTKHKLSVGERIVDQGVRVTGQQARVLSRLAELLQERGGTADTGGQAWRYLTRTLLLTVALGLFGWLAMIHFRHLLQQRRFILTITTVLALFVLGSSLALRQPDLGPMAAPMVLLALLATVLYKDKVGYVTTILATTLLALLPGISAAAVFVWFVLGMVTVISVRRIQKRSEFYQTILLLVGLSVAMIFLIGREALGHHGDHVYLVGIFAPILSVALGLFLLPVVEPLVGVCSDLTLLELSDLNHPLLQRMALEAQGTYHHSQVVGQLAEHAARAIDANALLTRVGALFHDIGKMQKSEYYVENQRPEFNKHDELSPSMSALVIAAHVKDGIELGRKWRLPSMVIDFIPEHHGTMVMEYFYHKALEGDGNETVKVDDFRYPGPKPQSRETAILMVADAVEAATRSLAKPTPSRIKEITKQIIDKRMLSGELDESSLTLSDIARIRESFIPLLTGIHHARIVYPGQTDKTGDRNAERKGDKAVRS